MTTNSNAEIKLKDKFKINEIYDINIATPNMLATIKSDKISWEFRAEKKRESLNNYINHFNTSHLLLNKQ